jgi:Holliday junction resolvase RusA-like endonuclease
MTSSASKKHPEKSPARSENGADGRIRIVLTGYIPSKKNRYLPMKGKLVKTRELRQLLESLEEQIPESVRGLKLRHPQMELSLAVPKGRTRMDRDGILTTILDVLKNTGVIQDDSIAAFNGEIVLHPVAASEELDTMCAEVQLDA